MQIIVNKDFSISQVEPSTVGQGSVNGAVISVFAPFSVGQYSAVKIYAELPNGEVLEPIAAFPIPSDSLGFGAWSVLVGGALTKYAGQVKIQLVFLATGEDSQPSTGIATFTVAQGITPVLPDPPDSNVYNDLLINIGELRSYFSSLFNQLPPSWVTNVSNPSDPGTPPTATAVYTFVSNIVTSLAERLAEELGEEATARENADNALGQMITDEGMERAYAISDLQSQITLEANTRAGAVAEIRKEALKVPQYDQKSGKMTFYDLNGEQIEIIDLILMSMLTNVRFDEANNEIVFSFRTHEGVESEVRVPLGNLTLPAWTTNVNTTNSEQLSVPPTTQAVKNAVSSEVSARQNADTALGTRINNEATSRGNADEAIKELAVKAPTLSNNVLIFKNLNDEEMTRITLPEGGGGGGSSGGSCSCYSVPIQEFEYNNDDPYSTLYRSFTFTEVAENTLKAFIHIAPPESVNCGGYPDMVISSDNPFGEEGAEEIYYAFDDVADSDYDDEFNVRISLNAPLTMTISYSAYSTPPSNWFIEITAKTDTREIWVYGQQMRAAY